MGKEGFTNYIPEAQNEKPMFPQELEQLREEIDATDNQILNLLAKRMQLAQQIGEYKRTHAIAPLDSLRWRKVINSRITRGEEKGLNGIFVAGVYERIHEESLNIQKRIKDEKNKPLYL